MSRMLRVFIVSTIIIAALILALLLAFNNLDGKIFKNCHILNNFIVIILLPYFLNFFFNTWKKLPGYNRNEKKTNDDNNSAINNETHLTSSIRPITQTMNLTESETRRPPTLNGNERSTLFRSCIIKQKITACK